jgi:hypothetical protein
MCRSSAVARQATAVFDELGMLNAERDRLTPDGIPGVATITGIGQNVATTALDTWHELVLEVRLPNRDPYRATRLVSVELSTASHIRVGAELGVLVDPQDRSKVLVVASPTSVGGGHARRAYRSVNLRKIDGGCSMLRWRAADFSDSAVSGAK